MTLRISGKSISVGEALRGRLSERTEEVLRGQRPEPAILKVAQDVLAREIAPIDDIRSTLRYRRTVAQNLLAEFIESLAG